MKEFYSFRHFYFEAGLIFWSYKGRIAGHHYALDSLNIPVRVYYSRALFSFLQPFESRALSWTFGYGFGPHFLVENFDQTEAFVALNKSFFFGLIWEDFLPETSLRYELNVGQSEFDFLNNLTVSGVSYRLGVVTRF